MAKENPKIIVLSGPSGAGKNSVAKILRQHPDEFVFSISSTSRQKRPDEIDGKDYYFISGKEFDETIKNDGFLEWESIHQNRYGTKKNDFEKLIRSGKAVVMIIDVKGAMNIKKMYPNSTTVFIIPPNIEELDLRLARRGTEDEKSRKIRKQRYLEELKYQDKYDYVIINDNLEKAQEELLFIASRKG